MHLISILLFLVKNVFTMLHPQGDSCAELQWCFSMMFITPVIVTGLFFCVYFCSAPPYILFFLLIILQVFLSWRELQTHTFFNQGPYQLDLYHIETISLGQISTYKVKVKKRALGMFWVYRQQRQVWKLYKQSRLSEQWLWFPMVQSPATVAVLWWGSSHSLCLSAFPASKTFRSGFEQSGNMPKLQQLRTKPPSDF